MNDCNVCFECKECIQCLKCKNCYICNNCLLSMSENGICDKCPHCRQEKWTKRNTKNKPVTPSTRVLRQQASALAVNGRSGWASAMARAVRK